MSIRLYFGLPGSGKTTLLAAHALKYVKKPNFNVYSNITLNIPRVIPIENEYVGQYRLHDGVILIDEATIFADSRNFKSFSSALVKLFCLHRHFKLDIELYLQNYSRTDLTIRMLADKVFWIRKVGGITAAVQIPMSVFIPKKDVADDTGSAGEIVNGYYRPLWYEYIFCEKIIRKKYYPYFDSFETYDLPELPDECLAHNPDTCNTNTNYKMEEEQLANLLGAFSEKFGSDLYDPEEDQKEKNEKKKIVPKKS